ncbi:SEFIR domain-containing protein [Paenibacillus ottowii]
MEVINANGKCFTKTELISANNTAIEEERNRKLNEDYLESLPENYLYPIALALDEHDRGEIRVQIIFDDKGTTGFLDMSKKRYNLLPVAEMCNDGTVRLKRNPNERLTLEEYQTKYLVNYKSVKIGGEIIHLPAEEEKKVPKVFISYSWSSEYHKNWVLDLATRLRVNSGVEVILDVWATNYGHDRFAFMENSIREADKVLIICDADYCQKANQRKGGVGTETTIITPHVYQNTEQSKFIPIALVKNSDGSYLLPDFLNSKFALGMMESENFEKQYNSLERAVWEEPLLVAPVIGKKPKFK